MTRSDLACRGLKKTTQTPNGFFSDIEGFTWLMDSHEEETVTKILNEYLDATAKIALNFGGTIDKFMGDGMMVFFGDPHS